MNFIRIVIVLVISCVIILFKPYFFKYSLNCNYAFKMHFFIKISVKDF